MTDVPETPLGTSAGALLRAAREKQGLHIAALAASIKVTPRKLEALERDRYDDLPDATFTRALAQTVCRSLKIDPAPVLALLPHAEMPGLDHVMGTLNAPFRDRPGREDPGARAVAAIRPMIWAGMLLLVAAAAVYLLPNGLFSGTAATPAPSASAPVAAPATAAPPQELAASVPLFPPPSAMDPAVVVLPPPPSDPAPTPMAVPEPSEAASSPMSRPALAPSGTLVQLRTNTSSWIEVRDARGQVLLSRLVPAGESVGLDGALPFKLTIGNASGTRVSFRGKVVDLAASTRDNVARLVLQ